MTLNKKFLFFGGDHQVRFYFIKGVSWKRAEMICVLLRETMVEPCANEHLKRLGGHSFF